MQGALGEKVGEGTFADVHAWEDGQIVKLAKPGIPQRISWYEERVTRAVFDAGAPAPEVFGKVTLEGRFGIVLARFDGPTLLQHYRSGAVTLEQAGAILASLAMSRFTRRRRRRRCPHCAIMCTARWSMAMVTFRTISSVVSSPGSIA